MPKALIVEDNDDLAKLIQIHLEDVSFSSDIANDGQSALNQFQVGKYEIILLDVMLPKIDGLEVCRTIRKSDQRVPILMLTARAEEIDRVVGLEVGADDYLTKPFGVAELTARVKALMRRANLSDQQDVNPGIHKSGKDTDTSVFVHGNLQLNTVKREVSVHGEKINLTLREFALLQFLLEHPAEVFSREQLLSEVWGYNNGVYQQTVNSHVNRLRAKIETDPSHPAIIETVWGVGYRLGDTA